MDSTSIVTVFGGTGFIGRAIIAKLARTGARIRVATRSPARAYFLRPLGGVAQITPIACDIHDDASVSAALKGATHAVNLIGVLFEKGKRQTFKRLHTDVPARIGRAAAAHKLSGLVHISALGADINAASHTGRSKGAGEAALRAAFPAAVILQPSVVFGAEDTFVNRFAQLARMTGTLPLIGGGKAPFQPVYVGDVAEAVMRTIDTPSHHGKTFALGGPDVLSFRQIFDLTLEASSLRALYIPLPAVIAKMMGAVAALLPTPFITVDQVRSLMAGITVPKDALTLADLGITPTPMRAVLPVYLAHYRADRGALRR